jgi:hypothetical protein
LVASIGGGTHTSMTATPLRHQAGRALLIFALAQA